MFVFSKLLWALVQPLSLLFLLSAGALLLSRRRPRLSRGLLAACCLLWLLLLLPPTANWLLEPLENRFPAPVVPEHVDGIVVLGGGSNAGLSQQHGQTALNEAGDRLIQAVILARRHPEARLVFTGGSGSLSARATPEASAVRSLWRELGVDDARITLEDASRNTFENAGNTLRMVQPRSGENWLLVTSALHMPRAVGCFRRVGWHVIPFPVDYRSPLSPSALDFEFAARVSNLSDGAKEWIGLLSYALLGRTSELFPAPEAASY